MIYRSAIHLATMAMAVSCALALNLQHEKSRRQVLATTAAAISSQLISSTAPAHADPKNALLPMGSGGIMMQPVVDTASGWKLPPLATKLGESRVSTLSLTPTQQLSPFAAQELYYPSFLFGEWSITSTLKQKTFPFGKDFVPSRSLMDGSPRNRQEQVGDSTTYLAHYFSTLADTPANQITVNLGLGVPEPKVIADRAFNVKEMSKAYKQAAPVESVEWDYRKDPTRLTLQMESMTSQVDGKPLGPRKAEVYLTSRQTEEGFDADTGKPIYATSERSRTVTVGPGSVSANDQEVITEYRQIDDNHLTAVSRIAVYLTPNPNSREGVLWQQVQGKAVAFYDYEFDMKRNLE
ncbi:MAG: hypothetical protein SGARI_002192, partial [Bacillariaceae sp.]